MPNLCLRVDDDLFARVHARASASNTTASAIMRELLEQWLSGERSSEIETRASAREAIEKARAILDELRRNLLASW